MSNSQAKKNIPNEKARLLSNSRLKSEYLFYFNAAYENFNTALYLQSQPDQIHRALEMYELGIKNGRTALQFDIKSLNEKEELENMNAKLRHFIQIVQNSIEELRKKDLSKPNTLLPSRPYIPLNVSVPVEQSTLKDLSSGKSEAKNVPDPPSHFISSFVKNPPVDSNDANRRPLSKNIDPKLANMILDEILDSSPNITWDDVVGLEAAKNTLYEIVILPSKRPDLFTGLRAPARGVLLFGPPGTGKTMLAKAVATESKAKFFSISAASLTSKYLGESEKLVRTMFVMARELQPSIIFIDEIDSLLTSRSSNEHEASRRLKTEFLLQFDGIGSEKDQILIMGATNRPQELDDAAIRRFTKRIYIPLPEPSTRQSLLLYLIKKHHHTMSLEEIRRVVSLTEGLGIFISEFTFLGYSCSDLTALAKEAALNPIRELTYDTIISIDLNAVRPINIGDFEKALHVIKKSVPSSSIQSYQTWNAEFGGI